MTFLNLCNYTSNTSENEFDEILRYFEKTVENILFDDNQARISKLSQTLQKISTLQNLAEAAKNRKNTQPQIHESRTKMAKKENLDLPNELWLKIINHLDTRDVFQNFALVCRRFHNLTIDASALKSMTLIDTRLMSNEAMESMKKVLQRSKKLQELEIFEDRHMEAYMIFKICFESCPKLKALHLTGFGWMHSMFVNSDFIWKTNIQHLRLLDDDGLGVYIASKLTNLRTLTIDFLMSRSNDDMNQIAEKCKKLEKVSIKEVISKPEFNEFIFRLNGSLKYLTVERFDSTSVNDIKTFLDNLRASKNLQELSLNASSFNGNDLLKAISEIPKLQKVELKNLGKIANEDVKLLARNCKELKYLKFDNCQSIHLENETVSSLIDDCPQLTKLTFHWAMVSKISNELWHKASIKSIDVFITIGKKTFTVQKYLTMMNSNGSAYLKELKLIL